LHDFDLRLVDVVDHGLIVPSVNLQEYENKPLREVFPIDLESLPSVPAPYGDYEFVFAKPFPDQLVVSREPSASMFVDLDGRTAQIQMYAHLFPSFLLDGPSIRFELITADVIPEPRAFSISTIGLLALGAWRYRIVGLIAEVRRRNSPA
jgi:hypothetical protein